MRFTDVFIRRPVLAIVVNLVILIAGIQALRTINVRQYPELEAGTIVVTTAYIGANAELVRGFVTTPLERAIAAANGIDYIESTSTQGLSTINVRLELGFSSLLALADVNARVAQVRADLPPEAEIPTIVIEPSDAQVAAMYLSFRSTVLADNQVTDYLLRVVQPRLSAIDGVQRADILGGRIFALRAWLDPERMAAVGVSPSEVHQALASNNYLAAVGSTKGALVQINLSATTDLETVEDFEQLVVREQGDTLVRLRDVAEVVLGAEEYDQDVRFSGERAVFMGVWVRPNASSLDTIQRVRQEVAAIQRELPVGMQARVAYDATSYIEDAIDEVTHTLRDTILIVVAVIFLFLGSLRTVTVPVIAIPLSLIGGVFLMQLFGFTLNLLTLLAIVLSVGLVVDDAIVVGENVQRHVREGKPPMQAAIVGARELVGPIIAITITLAAVYLPIGLQGGLTGALFREFAFTLAGTVFVSGVVALTLSPMMSSRLLRSGGKRGWFGRGVDRTFEATRRGYLRVLEGTLAIRPAVYVVWIVLSLLVVPLYILSPKELAPNEDQGVIFGAIDAPANASLEQVSAYTEQVYEVFKNTPEFSHSFQLTLPSGGFGGMLVVPWQDRERSIFPIQFEVNAKLASITGIRAPVFLPAALPSAGQFPVEVVIASTADHEQLASFADQLVQAAAASGQFAFPPQVDVRIDQQRVELVVERSKVATMGRTMQQIALDLSAMLSGDYVNRFDIDGRSYKVIPQIERSGRLTAEQLTEIHVSGPDGQLVPLGGIASLQRRVEPRSLTRFQQLNAIKISGVATRSVDGALRVLEDEAARILPPGFRVDYTGESRQLR